jgi:DNA-binding HxlR family transcriptional regulator
MGVSYRQFCPVAKAMELLDERWTMLVIREMLAGSRHFNEIRRGLPRMSPALLSRRLNQLVAAGLVIKEIDDGEVRYLLSPAGSDLGPVIDGLAVWAVQWIGDLGDHELDPRLLMWDLHRRVDLRAVPSTRTVLAFQFDDMSPRLRHWWMVIMPTGVDVCDRDPGFEVGVQIRTTLREMIKIWRGDTTLPNAARAGVLSLDGPTSLRRALPSWFDLPGQAWTADRRSNPQSKTGAEWVSSPTAM